MQDFTSLESRLLPPTGFLRLHDIVGRAERVGRQGRRVCAAIPALFPVSRSTWWAGVRAGRYPQPVKIGRRCTAWRVEDIRALIEGEGGSARSSDKYGLSEAVGSRLDCATNRNNGRSWG